MAYTGSSSIESIANHIKFNYSNVKSTNMDTCVSSPTFTAGGHECLIVCFNHETIVVLYIMLLCKSEEVSVITDMHLLDKHGKPSSTTWKRSKLQKYKPGSMWGNLLFIKKTDMEANYIDTEGCFVVVCVVKLEGESCNQVPKKHRVVEFMQSDMLADCSKLLVNREMSDVIFQVKEESFAAHKLILAARSPVFKAELFGSMSESGSQVRPIVIKEMQPDVFKAMLHFVYTYSVPELGDKKNSFMLAQHLIVAADRYGIERLKLICEERLCDNISLDTVVSSLAIAGQHNCTQLKNSSLEFVAVPKNFFRLTLDKEYINLSHGSPSLLGEIEAKTSQNPSFMEITRT